jgi:hypothetical protein
LTVVDRVANDDVGTRFDAPNLAAWGLEGEPTIMLKDGRLLGLDFRLTNPLIYDPVTDSHTAVETAGLTPRVQYSAALLGDGPILVAGGAVNLGSGNFATSQRVKIYDPATNGWSDGESILMARLQHTATRLGECRILVVGGTADIAMPSARLASTEIYDQTPTRGLQALP